MAISCGDIIEVTEDDLDVALAREKGQLPMTHGVMATAVKRQCSQDGFEFGSVANCTVEFKPTTEAPDKFGYNSVWLTLGPRAELISKVFDAGKFDKLRKMLPMQIRIIDGHGIDNLPEKEYHAD